MAKPTTIEIQISAAGGRAVREPLSEDVKGVERRGKGDARSAQLSGVLVASVNGRRNKMLPAVSVTSPTTSRSLHSSLALLHVVAFHRWRLSSSCAAASAALAMRRSCVGMRS